MRASSVTVAVANRGTGPIVADVGELDQWKHCPRCGAEVEPGGGKVECAECGFRAYASSKPTASAVCLDDEGRVLLSRRGDRSVRGQVGPSRAGSSTRRSIRSTASAGSSGRRRASRSSRSSSSACGWTATGATARPRTTLNFYWTARIVEGVPEPPDDVAELRWFAPAEIPDDDLAFPHTREVLAALGQKHA